MQFPLEISFRNVPKTDAVEKLIHETVGKLRQVCNYLIGCRVAVESPQQHQQSGNPFRVRISMSVPPGHELVVKRESGEGHLHAELPVVLRDAFQAARRQLQELVERQRGEVKTHPQQETMAFVARLFPDQGYGFLRTVDDREIYFHRNSVLHDDFDRLKIGTGVRFVEKEGEKGPQASTVEIVDKPGTRVSAEQPELL
ncbi:MAG: cold shock domain-containing protein [Syntrophobacteria bacterium]